MSSYESLKIVFEEFISLKEEETQKKVIINIYKFDIKKFRNKEKLLTEYILFIVLKLNKILPEKTDVHVYMKDANKSHFFPLYLSKVLRPLNEILKGKNSPELLRYICVYDVPKAGTVVWNIVKHLFHKDTVKKIQLIT